MFNVLIVDDEVEIIELMEVYLLNEGYNVFKATNGLDALNIINEEISQNVNIVANGNMDIDIPIRAENELGLLASDINKMAYSIKELMTKERQWENQKNNLITNLSHDLRTPLTSVVGFLELIQKRKYKNDDELTHYCEISLNKNSSK